MIKLEKSYEITKEELKEIQKERKKTKNKNEDKRLYAIELRAQGIKGKDIAEKLDISRITVSKWVGDFKKEGIKGILNKKRIGNKNLKKN